MDIILQAQKRSKLTSHVYKFAVLTIFMRLSGWQLKLIAGDLTPLHDKAVSYG